MPNIRRGAGAGASRRARTARRIDSRNGSDIATPEPRRKRRREIGRRLDANGAVDRDPVCAFIADLSYLFRNRSLCTIAWTRLRTPYWLRLRRVEDLLDLLPVGEPHRRAGGEDRQLPGQVPRDRPFVLDQQPLELAHVLERPAVGQLAGRIDRQAVVERERLPVHAEALDSGVTFSATAR